VISTPTKSPSSGDPVIGAAAELGIALLVVTARILSIPLGKAPVDVIVILSIYWAISVRYRRSKSWVWMTAGTMAYLLLIYLVPQCRLGYQLLLGSAD
jgi:hypothetical protein